jgi:predicted alpha/beta-fold hydrolase
MTAGPGVSEQHVQFRERVRMPADGAVVALDWELPAAVAAVDTTTSTNNLTLEQRKEQVLKGPIPQPVVLILHGINNDAGFGYMRSMMRECTARGWIAVGMNFRGCGGVPMTTPRTYNGAYTGDIRGVVQTLSPRLHGQQQPLFLVGNSLGANLLAKYLGEEGKSGTLPACVAGGVTMGNPMVIDSRNMSPIYSPLIAAGAKQGLFSVYHSMKNMQSSFLFRKCMHDAWTAFSLADYDRALAPIFSRNDPEYPFGYKIGYESGEAYWKDASSYRQTPFVSVPFLQLVAKDDFLVFHPFRGKLAYNVSNPNVMVMETTCGGHLGWQETPPNGWGLGTSWADAAMADFIQAVLESYREKQLQQQKLQGDTRRADIVSGYREDGRPEGPQLRSRL